MKCSVISIQVKPISLYLYFLYCTKSNGTNTHLWLASHLGPMVGSPDGSGLVGTGAPHWAVLGHLCPLVVGHAGVRVLAHHLLLLALLYRGNYC